jgi:hypothetical protein
LRRVRRPAPHRHVELLTCAPLRPWTRLLSDINYLALNREPRNKSSSHRAYPTTAAFKYFTRMLGGNRARRDSREQLRDGRNDWNGGRAERRPLRLCYSGNGQDLRQRRVAHDRAVALPIGGLNCLRNGSPHCPILCDSDCDYHCRKSDRDAQKVPEKSLLPLPFIVHRGLNRRYRFKGSPGPVNAMQCGAGA